VASHTKWRFIFTQCLAKLAYSADIVNHYTSTYIVYQYGVEFLNCCIGSLENYASAL